MDVEEQIYIQKASWKPISEEFLRWLDNRHHLLEPGLIAEPTIKILIFLALFDAQKPCTYDDLREIFKFRNVINGVVPDNTLRTSVLNLTKTLNKYEHPFELKSLRGSFQLVRRNNILKNIPKDPVVLLLEPPAVEANEIAKILIEKAMLPFHALYFLEWPARWWETYSSKEAEIRIPYESGAWERLGIRNRLLKSNNSDCISMIGLAPGEGLAEIELLKKILRTEKNKKIHYLAVDSSPRLLRDHIGLLKETLSAEIEAKQLLCAGVVADIFSNLRDAIGRARVEFKENGIVDDQSDFIPSSSSMLITYFGNCLGNNYQDQETELFTMIYSVFQNRPIEFLVGVSVMQETPEEYKRNWDDFLLQTPRHLLESKNLLKSSITNNLTLPEFILPQRPRDDTRCPSVVPEPYIVRHQIKGQIYRFYYKLAHALELEKTKELSETLARSLPKGTLILLYSIIKYNMKTLVEGIEKCGLFKIEYDETYHQVVDTPNGKREYAVFSAYLES